MRPKGGIPASVAIGVSNAASFSRQSLSHENIRSAKKTITAPENLPPLLIGLAVFGSLSLISRSNYLLFHSIAETFSIVIACGVFMFAWNSRRFLDSDYFVYLGVASLFVAGLDLLHTLAYKGMGVFPDYTANLPTQLWIAARYLASLSFLVSPAFFHWKLRPRWIIGGYLAVCALLLGTVFYWKVFPDCYIEGQGLTRFKKISEYIISLILLAAIGVLLHERHHLDSRVLRWLIGALIASIFSELCFTLYVGVYSRFNEIGHFLKIVTFYLMYKAVIETGLTKPYALLLRNLARAEQQYRALFEHSLSGIALYEAIPSADGPPVDYSFLSINPAFERQSGLRADQVLGRGAISLLPELGQAPLAEDLRQVVETGEPARFEHFSPTLDKYFTIAAFSLHKGQLATVLDDITERKIAETERERLIAELDAFAHTVAHDLKNPMGVIILGAELVEEALKTGQVDDRTYSQMDTVVEYICKMESIINELLLLASIRRLDEVPVQPLEMQPIVHNATKRLGYMVSEQQAEISLPDHWPQALGYAPWVEEIWTNYLSNAIKYGGHPPRIAAGGEAQANGTVRFWVRDNGPGIPAEDLARLFVPFTRLAQAHTGGHGLGLSIAQRIAERLNGSVSVESVIGEGSTFSFTLPGV
jgi:PAS domain S-box-containing protein